MQPEDYPADAEPHEIAHWTKVRVSTRVQELAEQYGIEIGLIDRYYEERLSQDLGRQLARVIYDEETGRSRSVNRPWDAGTLAEQLQRPEPPAARVAGLLPWDASTTVVAQRKVGKTTLILNLARCLITGEPFLDMEVRKVEGRVAILNFEVSGHQLSRWADEAGIPREQLFIVNLRGASNPFREPARLAELAELLRAEDVETLIVDPFGRAFSGDNQNDSGQVQAWLVALDEFARTAVGAKDLILTVHAGWEGERSRGSSALEDWPDSLIYLTRHKVTGDRYLSATGRDVDLPEDLLAYDPDTRALSLTGAGSRHGAGIRALTDLAVQVVTETPGLKTTHIAEELKKRGAAFQRGDESRALKTAVADGRLRCETGARNAKHYYPEAGDFDDDVI